LLREWSGVGPGCPGQWGSPHPWRGSDTVWLWHLGTGFSRHGGVGVTAGLDDIKALFQPWWFCDSMIPGHTPSVSMAKSSRASCCCLPTPPATGSSWAPSSPAISRPAPVSPSLPLCRSQEPDWAPLAFPGQEGTARGTPGSAGRAGGWSDGLDSGHERGRCSSRPVPRRRWPRTATRQRFEGRAPGCSAGKRRPCSARLPRAASSPLSPTARDRLALEQLSGHPRQGWAEQRDLPDAGVTRDRGNRLRRSVGDCVRQVVGKPPSSPSRRGRGAKATLPTHGKL